MAARIEEELLDYASYETAFADLSMGQQRANQIVLRIASIASMCGSGYTVWNLLGPQRQNELYTNLFSRLLFGLCLADFLASAALFMGSWPIPQDSFHMPNLVWNVGNQITCTVQGFFLQTFYIASIFYTASISVNFLLCVKYQWTEDQLRQRVEIYLHAVSWLVPVTLSILCLIFDLYNPTAFFCYVATYPIGCDHNDNVPCLRGDHIGLWRSVAQLVPFGVCLSTVVYCMTRIYFTIRAHELAVAQHSDTWVAQTATDSLLAMKKAAQYIGLLVVVWTPVLIVTLCQDLGRKIPFWIWLMDASLMPIVGLLNSIVYTRFINPVETVTNSVSTIQNKGTQVLQFVRSSFGSSSAEMRSASQASATIIEVDQSSARINNASFTIDERFKEAE